MLVARSYGSLISRLYVSRYPSEVAGIVLVDGTHEQQVQRFGTLDSTYPRKFRQYYDSLLRGMRPGPEADEIRETVKESELQSRLKNPADTDAADLEKRRKEIVETAIKNQDAYLASDHLDVYVATSMRAQHEFISIGRIVEKIFNHDAIKTLKLRWFDPTQAYCANRIDKGLAEALMLRRASCTIYLAQETDTLGKDSELASTLAQGKPVIAFVPEVDAEFLQEHFEVLSKANPKKTKAQHLMDQLQLFECGAAWVDKQVRGWCDAPHTIAMDDLEKRVHGKIKQHYDGRAKTLRETHPLGIQVNLGTGVACGVMVVRSAADCAQIVRGIVTRTLQFTVEEEKEYIFLRENISKSIFRVMTSDAMLTNAFWNFYLEPAE